MSRILRLAVLLLMLTLTLIPANEPIGARWVRLGNLLLVINVQSVCKDKVTIYAGYAFNGSDQRGRGFNVDGAFAIIRLLTSAKEVPPESRPVIAASEIPIKEHETLIKNIPIDPNGDPRMRSSTYYYGSVEMELPPTIDSFAYPYIEVKIQSPYENRPPFRINDGIPYIPADDFKIQDCADHGPNFTDGRVDAYEPWESVAAYCEDKMVKVYGIDANGSGYFAFAVTQEDIDKLGIPKENMLLASFPSAFSGKIRLYKLKDTGELQINAPGLPPDSWKEYVFTWAGCA